MKTYEGMFLVDPASTDFQTASAPIQEMLSRIGAEVLVMKPWDERRLAYDIQGRKRGLYVLAYFKADPAQMSGLNHEAQISEQVLRMMVLSADHVSREIMETETPATQSQARRSTSEARSQAPDDTGEQVEKRDEAADDASARDEDRQQEEKGAADQ